MLRHAIKAVVAHFKCLSFEEEERYVYPNAELEESASQPIRLWPHVDSVHG